MKYLIINKNTNKIYDQMMYDTTSMPINEQELAYVPITTEMEEALTNHNIVIDYQQTTFNNGAWQVVLVTPEKNNILADRTSDKNRLIAEANKKLLVPDASQTFKTLVQAYITELNAITPTSVEIQVINWPTKPW